MASRNGRLRCRRTATRTEWARRYPPRSTAWDRRSKLAAGAAEVAVEVVPPHKCWSADRIRFRNRIRPRYSRRAKPLSRMRPAIQRREPQRVTQLLSLNFHQASSTPAVRCIMRFRWYSRPAPPCLPTPSPFLPGDRRRVWVLAIPASECSGESCEEICGDYCLLPSSAARTL